MFLFVAEVDNVLSNLSHEKQKLLLIQFSQVFLQRIIRMDKFDDLFLKVGLLVYDITCIIALNLVPVIFFSLWGQEEKRISN